jgi:hypothetical protein
MCTASDDLEEVLGSEGVTRVVRVGATIRRPVRPFTATIQSYLAHLHAHGFHNAPEPSATTNRTGRSSFASPARCKSSRSRTGRPHSRFLLAWPAWFVGYTMRPRGGRLPRCRLRRPSRHPPPGVQPLFAVPELVYHQDYCPGNVVFQDGQPAALIDFDLARPTTRLADAVNALYWWVPLLHPEDRPPALVEADAAERVRIFAGAYGMSRTQRAAVAATAVRRAANATLTMHAAAEADPVFRRWWDGGVKDRMPRAEHWIVENADRLHAQLLR